jgi:polyferredoxin
VKKNRSSIATLRWVILLLILGFVTINAYLHQHPQILGKTASVCALCPTGAIESFLYWIRTGFFLHRVALSSLILFVSILVTALLFRRSFCGQFCPFGTLQEIVGSIGNQIKSIRSMRNKTKRDSFRWTKYIVIAAFIAVPWFTSSLFFRHIDPWVAYAHITTNEIFGVFLWGFLVLVVCLIGSFIWDRFFCKYVCPLGGFLSIIAPLGLFRIVRNTEQCIICSKCNIVCPMNIDVCHLQEITDPECIMCLQCVDACPHEDCLVISSKAGTRVSPVFVVWLTFIIIIGLVAITTITGHFQWIK